LNILLVKLSSLGDVVHTLPVVHDLLAVFPDAQVDWVVERLLRCRRFESGLRGLLRRAAGATEAQSFRRQVT